MRIDTFLVDTNVISNAQKKKPHPTLAAWLAGKNRLAIPFPVILEIERGIAEVSISKPQRAAELRRWLDDLFQLPFVYPEITPQVARNLAAMQCCRHLEYLWRVDSRSKTKKPGQDLFIAAVSLTHKIPLATLDWRDFMRIHRYFPLPGLYHPIRDIWLVHPKIGEQAFNAA